MNTSHYPSLELCKKLSKIGFSIPSRKFGYSPHSELAWFWTTKGGWYSQLMDCGELEWYKRYVCPSVMEMLDVIPSYILWKDQCGYILMLQKDFVCYFREEGRSSKYYRQKEWTLANSLAEMILWLHENNYISFNN